MAKIPWGKPRLFVINVDETGAKAYELATPVEDSTNLTPTKGDKQEAKIEGGENEDVKFKRSTYATTFNIRKKTGRKQPFPSVDGVVNDHFGLMLMPEDDDTEGFLIEANTVSIDDTFTAADGAIWQCQLDAVKAEAGDTVKWGTVKIVSGDLVFTERTSAEDGETPYTVTWELDPTTDYKK